MKSDCHDWALLLWKRDASERIYNKDIQNRNEQKNVDSIQFFTVRKKLARIALSKVHTVQASMSFECASAFLQSQGHQQLEQSAR